MKGEQFLFFDSGKDDLDRVLIFTTDRNLSILNCAESTFVDGTFSVSPEIFYQIFTINSLLRNKCLPLVYGCLPKKDVQTYVKFFSALRDK